MEAPSKSKITSIKAARFLVYLVYTWLVIATVFLFLGFILLLLGANPSTSFVNFVYSVAGHFLEPFRGMFPPKQINSTSYFSSAGLFAIIFYSIVAFFIHSLIDYITMKLRKNEMELERATYDAKLAQSTATTSAQRKPASSTTRQVR